jgi:hypothetical protein
VALHGEDAVDGDCPVALDGQRAAFEAELGMVRAVEEVGRREMLGELLVVDVDARRLRGAAEPLLVERRSNSRNTPSKGAIPMYTTRNPIVECVGSLAQVPVTAVARSAVVLISIPSSTCSSKTCFSK